MKFSSLRLPVVAFILQTMISATQVVAFVDFERVHGNGRTTISTLNATFQRFHYSLPTSEPFVTYRYSSIRKKWLPTQVLSIRGGSNNNNPPHLSASSSSTLVPPIFDMDRMKIRLDGLSQYAVICALLLNVCLNIYYNTMKHLDIENSSGSVLTDIGSSPSSFMPQSISQFLDRGMKVVKVIFILSSTFSIISSAYTVVVFTLLGIYSKAALGMGCDTNFLQFFDTTQKLRTTAFDAFVISLVNFEISFLLSLIIAYKGHLKGFIVAITAACLSYSFYHWASIITIAGRLLFSSSVTSNSGL